MKRTAIVLGAMVLTLMVGFSIASVAYADDWTPFSVNNNLGILLYNDIHAPAVAPGKCEVRNYGSGEMTKIKDVEVEGIGSVSSSDNNLGVLLAAERDIPEAKGSGAGGVAGEKCAMMTRKGMKSGVIFDEIYGRSTTDRPF